MKFQLFNAIVLALLLTGCQKYTIDAEYASSSKGFINSGLRTIGDVFLYDMNKSQLTHLTTIPINCKTSCYDVKLRDIDTSYGIKGITIKGEVDKEIEANIKGEISQNAYVELENVYKRSPKKDGYMILIDQINSRNTIEKEQLVNAWHLTEATRQDSVLRYVVITSTYVADKAHFKYKNQKLLAGEFTPIMTLNGKIEVKVLGISEQKMEGKKIPVLFRMQQFKASIQHGNYFFSYENVKPEKMVEALQAAG